MSFIIYFTANFKRIERIRCLLFDYSWLLKKLHKWIFVICQRLKIIICHYNLSISSKLFWRYSKKMFKVPFKKGVKNDVIHICDLGSEWFSTSFEMFVERSVIAMVLLLHHDGWKSATLDQNHTTSLWW